MKRLLSSTLFLLVLLFQSGITFSQTIEGYLHKKVMGFDVYIEREVIRNDNSAGSKALAQIKINLEEISRDFGLSEKVIAQLQETKIFIDWDTQNKGAVYHPNKVWLIDNGYIPEKEKSIEISNINNFLSWSAQNQPYMLFHELAHAYHHQQFGFNNSEVHLAYQKAIKSGKYGDLKYYTGNENYITRKAYASVNHKEYFAELSEAYFGTNDFYPFSKKEIQEYDPGGYKLIRHMWGVQN